MIFFSPANVIFNIASYFNCSLISLIIQTKVKLHLLEIEHGPIARCHKDTLFIRNDTMFEENCCAERVQSMRRLVAR